MHILVIHKSRPFYELQYCDIENAKTLCRIIYATKKSKSKHILFICLPESFTVAA